MTNVWILFCEETVPFAEPGQIEDIFATEELAQKRCDELNKDQHIYLLKQWRDRYEKRPDEFPDKDLNPYYNYYILAWDVKTE